MSRPPVPLVDRFYKQVEFIPFHTCWEWTGYKIRGYGQIKHTSKKTVSAHRTSYELHKGPIPTGMWVCHRCDNPSCVNPDHLFLGTSMDNYVDMVAKGRRADSSGEKNSQSKVTADQVVEIRRAYAAREGSQYALARKFGMTQSAISHIVSGKNWRTV